MGLLLTSYRVMMIMMMMMVVEEEDEDEEGLMQSPLFVLTCIESGRMYMYSKRSIILI